MQCQGLYLTLLASKEQSFHENVTFEFSEPFCWKLDHCELLRLLRKGNDRLVQGQTPHSLQGLGHSLFVSKEQ